MWHVRDRARSLRWLLLGATVSMVAARAVGAVSPLSPPMRMTLDESLELDTQVSPPERVTLENWRTPHSRAYFAVWSKGQVPRLRAPITERTYRSWHKRLLVILQTKEKSSCKEAFFWAKTELGRRTERGFCPKELSHTHLKNLDSVSNEIVALLHEKIQSTVKKRE